LKHLPSLGGHSESKKFGNIYADTLSFYKAVFGMDPKPHMWEPAESKFTGESLEQSEVNLNRLANLSIKAALGHLKHADLESREKRCEQILKGKIERRYDSTNRRNYITSRRKIRVEIKEHIKLKA
jgi:hypothetical protein